MGGIGMTFDTLYYSLSKRGVNTSPTELREILGLLQISISDIDVDLLEYSLRQSRDAGTVAMLYALELNKPKVFVLKPEHRGGITVDWKAEEWEMVWNKDVYWIRYFGRYNMATIYTMLHDYKMQMINN